MKTQPVRIMADLIARCLDEIQRMLHLGAGLCYITEEVAEALRSTLGWEPSRPLAVASARS